MAYLEKEEIYTAYTDASDEADQWRKDYPQYERLADNGLLEDLDENLPEVNDGSLAASLFKLAKRVIKKKLAGRAIALDTDDQWITELANIYMEKKILPNAKTKASPRRKWKDAARKAAIYGGQPIITLFVERGNYRGGDFIVPYAPDVKLEAGKDSDGDSDIIFWDIYYSKLQLRNMREQAEAENKAAKESNEEAYNKWDLSAIDAILDMEPEEDRPGNQQHREKLDKGINKSGYHFYIAFQRGVDAPFMMCHPGTKKVVREWSNPDPTGDLPVHYLYYYQDFINPYGIGVVKLAGGTQNVLDYMRQADILATQLGLRPPKQIKGDEDQVDEDSLVYAQDANWYVGNASVERVEMANGVYSELPNRISMYKTSLNQMIPTGDTSISAENSGDPQYSKTPAGVKFQQEALSVDDEDFSENIDECYADVMRSVINVTFANMQGADLMKLNDDERDMLQKAGLDFPLDEEGEASNDLEILWDSVRASFDFEIDPDADKTADEEAALEGKLKAYEMVTSDPNIDMYLQMDGKRLNRGELLGDIFSQLTDNDKIIQDISPEEQQMAEEQQAMIGGVDQNGQLMDPTQGGTIDPETGKPLPQATGGQVPGEPVQTSGLQPEEEEAGAQIEAVMATYEVDEQTAAAMLEAERQGFEPEEIMEALQRQTNPEPANAA